MKIVTLFLILITTSYAQNAVTLNKGDIAPFRGALIKPDKLDELVKAKKKNIVLEDLRMAQDEIIQYHKDDANRQRVKLSKAQFNSFWSNTGYFVLGVLITGFAFKTTDAIKDM